MRLRRTIVGIALLFATGLAVARDRVVYHASDTEAQALGAFRKLDGAADVDSSDRLVPLAHR